MIITAKASEVTVKVIHLAKYNSKPFLQVFADRKLEKTIKIS
jgi:hypothetical protein